MKTPHRKESTPAGFTLVEIMITMTIMMMVTAGALGVFLTGLRAMYKDMQRLATDATLRTLTLQVAKETLDSSEFYVFPSYLSLDGNVDIVNDVSQLAIDAYGCEVAYGDCLVLVTRVSVDETSKVRQFRIYYRTTTNENNQAAIRYYEGTDYTAVGSNSTLTTLLNGVNLATNWATTGRQIVRLSRGRPITTSPHWCPLATPPYTTANQCTHTNDYYPIFSTESATTTATSECVSINVEVINGTIANNQLSSSTFNFTISPRR